MTAARSEAVLREPRTKTSTHTTKHKFTNTWQVQMGSMTHSSIPPDQQSPTAIGTRITHLRVEPQAAQRGRRHNLVLWRVRVCDVPNVRLHWKAGVHLALVLHAKWPQRSMSQQRITAHSATAAPHLERQHGVCHSKLVALRMPVQRRCRALHGVRVTEHRCNHKQRSQSTSVVRALSTRSRSQPTRDPRAQRKQSHVPRPLAEGGSDEKSISSSAKYSS